MSKLLSVMRHAKSSWDEPGLEDLQRPLMPKGVKRTKRVVDYLVAHQIMADQIWTSPAKRALDAATLVQMGLKLTDGPMVKDFLYENDPESITPEILKCPNNIKHLLIVGHNPVFTELINQLAKKTVISWLPTSGIVTLEFETEKWDQILTSPVSVIHVILPKELKK